MKKKTIVNDLFTPGAAVIGISFFALYILGIASSDLSFSGKAVGVSVGCGFLALGVLAFFLSFELIFFYEDRMVCWKFSKRIEIFYSDIVSVQIRCKALVGGLSCENMWEFVDSNNKEINIIKRFRRREKIIEQIKKRMSL